MSRILYIIANYEYDDEAYHNLDCVKNDYEKVSELFDKYGEFNKIVPLANKLSYETCEVLEEGFDKLECEDDLFVYYSGHGDIKNSKMFLVAKNTKKSSLSATSINADFIVEQLGNSKAKSKTLILDCCYSGAIFDSMTKSGLDENEIINNVTQKKFSDAEGVYIIASSKSNEVSYTGESLSLFTGLMVKGIETYEADYNKSGYISIDELYKYINDNIDRHKQKPQRYVNGSETVDIARYDIKGENSKIEHEFDVFLCHNSKDKPEVKKIGDQLRKRGLNPWLDEWCLRPGFPWQDELEKQIKNIKSVAVFVGDDGIGPWQNQELSAFLRKFVKNRCPVIPVIFSSNKTIPELPIFLEGMTWVDFRKDNPDPIKHLIWGITGNKYEGDQENKSKERIEKYKKQIENSSFLKESGEFVPVRIKGDTYLMGSPENEYGRRQDEKQHQVKVSDFVMSKYLVTIAQFEKFVHEENYRADNGDNWRMGSNGKIQNDKQHPVANVSWNDAKKYCKWLSNKYNVEFRLPTEAEWEYACRAGTTTPFSTGENLTTRQANYNGNYPYKNYPKGGYKKHTTPVGTYPSNTWGLYDMHGNVWEWCEDWYSKNYYDECNNMGLVQNPTGSVTGSDRVLRGGSWGDSGRNCRSAYRDGSAPGNRNGNIGFRLVFVP